MVAGMFEMFMGERAVAGAGIRYAERRAVIGAAESSFERYGAARVERAGFERIARYGERSAFSLLESARTEYVSAELHLAREAGAIGRASKSLSAFEQGVNEDIHLMGLGAFVADIGHLADTVMSSIKDINGSSGNGDQINNESKDDASQEISRTLNMLMEWGG